MSANDASALRYPARELMALYLHRTIVRLGLGVTGTFTVVFFYQFFGESVLGALLSYIAIFTGTALLTPWGASFLNHVGIRGTMLRAIPLLALAACTLALASVYDPANPQAFLIVLISIVGTFLYRALYWVPYSVGISETLTPGSEGRQVATLTNLADILVAAMPLIGGLVLSTESFQMLFLIGGALFALSAVPLFFIPNRYECFSWDTRETFRQLLNPDMRPMVYATVGDGIQFGVLAVVWPLLIFLLLGGDYETVGAVTTLTLIATLLLRSLVGRYMDRLRGSPAILYWGVFFSATGWLFKAFVVTPFQVIVVDTYHGLGQAVYRTSVDVFTYEQAADNGSYIDEYTALKEVALNVGRAAGLLVVALCVALFGVAAGFTVGILFAATATIAATLLSQQQLLAKASKR